MSRGDSGFAVWSHTCDRPIGEAPAVEDAIAVGSGRRLTAARAA